MRINLSFRLFGKEGYFDLVVIAICGFTEESLETEHCPTIRAEAKIQKLENRFWLV